MLTPGIGPMTTQFSLAGVRAAVEEARRFGRKVTAHAHGADVVTQVVEAGVDGIEHGGCWTIEGAHAAPELIDRIAEQQITVCPTGGILPPEMLPDLPPPPVLASRFEGVKAVIAQMH